MLMVRQTMLTAIAFTLFTVVCRAIPVPYLLGSEPISPSIECAAKRGPQIFNAVFDSLRKYNSAVHPNGMSFFVATIPEGVLLHHGNSYNSSPTTLDWIAYEFELAEMFATGSHRPKRKQFQESLSVLSSDGRQVLLHGDSGSGTSLEKGPHGWLHTYRTTRPLRFLYIDGMSGNKDDSGVIDSQDYILRALSSASDDIEKIFLPKNGEDQTERPPGPPTPPGELERASDLCKLCTEWQLQGVIRTEDPGMEIIKCNFLDGLEELQSVQHADPDYNGEVEISGNQGPGREPGERPGSRIPYDFENCFHDIGSSRTILDYSTMVSAFFFPVNLTNPNQDEKELPRLVWSNEEERLAIKEYLSRVVIGDQGGALKENMNWRDIADLIVRRYANRITLMANTSAISTSAEFTENVQSLLKVFIDYSVTDAEIRESEARERCATFYLQTKSQLTESDQLIYAAFKATNEKICNTLFDVKNLVTTNEATSDILMLARESFQLLMEELNWTVFYPNL